MKILKIGSDDDVIFLALISSDVSRQSRRATYLLLNFLALSSRLGLGVVVKMTPRYLGGTDVSKHKKKESRWRIPNTKEPDLPNELALLLSEATRYPYNFPIPFLRGIRVAMTGGYNFNPLPFRFGQLIGWCFDLAEDLAED